MALFLLPIATNFIDFLADLANTSSPGRNQGSEFKDKVSIFFETSPQRDTGFYAVDTG